MKALLLLALVLALGAGVLFFLVLEPGEGRGARPEAAARPTAESAPTPVTDAGPAPPKTTPSEPVAAPQRQSVETAAAPEARAVFEGSVVGDGAPVPGAGIELLQQETQLAKTVTDSRGRFRIETPPLTGGGTLRVLARGFVPAERSLVAKPAGGTVLLGNVRLVRGQRLEGRVVDVAGQGIPDAAIRVEPINAAGDTLVAHGRSLADGRFEIADAPPGVVLVGARATGFGERNVQHARGVEPLLIQLEPGAELRLLLRAPHGQAVTDAEVTIQAPNDPRATKRVQRSDAEGRVLFEGLGTRVWTVRVTHPEYRPSGRSQVKASGAEEVIECLPWPAIEGVVRAPNGAPPPRGTRVQALPASAPSDRIAPLEGGQEVGADGRFRVVGLRAGDWRVRVAAPGFAPALSQPVKLGIEGDGYAGTIELQAGGELAVVVACDGKPVAGAEIELFVSPPTPAQLWAFASSRGLGGGKRVPSRADGQAELANLPPGAVWLAIYAEGFPPTASGPHDVSGGSSAPIPIALERGARLEGRVRAKSGAPVARAQLRIVERDGRLGFPLTLASEDDGRYTSAWLPAGHYTVEAFAPEDPTLRSGTHELDLRAGERRALDLEL